MVPFSVEYLTTPTRGEKRPRAEDDPETDSSSPGTNSSGGSPTLNLAMSGEDAIESPPLRSRLAKKPNTIAIELPDDDDEEDKQSTSTADPANPNEKPGHSYMALISMAILQHPNKKLLLGDIYQFIMDKFAFYRNATDKAWRNSIRHNLSLNECFIKAGRAENGKGNFWAIHPACEQDFARGDFRRRQARRRARRSQEMNVSKLPIAYRCNLGYVQMKSTPASGINMPMGTGPTGVPIGSSGYGVNSHYPHHQQNIRAHPYQRPPHHHPHVATHHQHQQGYPGSPQYYPYEPRVSLSPPSQPSHISPPRSVAGPADPHMYYPGGPQSRVDPTVAPMDNSMASSTYTLTSVTSRAALSSCVYQPTGPQGAYPAQGQRDLALPGPAGSGPAASMAQFSLRDMPALRDAIAGLPGFCS